MEFHDLMQLIEQAAASVATKQAIESTIPPVLAPLADELPILKKIPALRYIRSRPTSETTSSRARCKLFLLRRCYGSSASRDPNLPSRGRTGIMPSSLKSTSNEHAD